MRDHYKDKVAVITVAASGIGRALAQRLAQMHCHLALSDVNIDGLKETVGNIDSEKVRLFSLSLANSQSSSHRKLK